MSEIKAGDTFMKNDGAGLSSGESLRIFLDNVAHELPIIRPIKEFIHLNLFVKNLQILQSNLNRFECNISIIHYISNLVFWIA